MARPLSKRVFFHIVRQGGKQGPALVTHKVLTSRRVARAEADRLSQATPGVRFYVMRSTYGYVSKQTTSTTNKDY